MRNISLLAIILLTLNGQAKASSGYAGAYTTIGSDARSVALAGATVADINSGYLAYTNPASLAYVDRLEVGLSHIALPLDRSLQSASIATRLPPTAAVSLSYIRAGDDKIQGRNSVGQPTGELTYADQMISLTFANQLTGTISMGMNANLLLISLADENAKGFAIDFGFLYHRPSGLNVAVRVRNLTGAYSWKVAAADKERGYKDYLPLVISAGTRLPWRQFVLFAATNLAYPRVEVSTGAARIGAALADPIATVHLALETEIDGRFYLRGGLNQNTPTIGVGLQYTIRKHKDSRVDYSFHPGVNREGFGHLFSWIFAL
ncbi:MAG: PorV/PorQ family protein [Candidatus Marinimicrobia bacterium]|nr:PorV/PorQ family protein [Candidatus Neomarinimicrobiota bacterium]